MSSSLRGRVARDTAAIRSPVLEGIGVTAVGEGGAAEGFRFGGLVLSVLARRDDGWGILGGQAS